MEKGWLWRQALLVAVAGVVAIAVIGFAVWRYDVALSRAAAALSKHADDSVAAALSTAYWQERQAIGRYVVAPKQAELRAAAVRHGRFQQLAARLRQARLGPGTRPLAQAVAANARYYSLFTDISGAPGSTATDPGKAFRQLEAAAAAVVPPLDALDRAVTLRASVAQAAAASSASRSRAIGIAAVLAIIAIGNALGSFVLRLLGRAVRRAHQLLATLGRLSDRDRLLAQLRSTSAVLGAVAGELRLAARNAAEVGSQQSAAVSQTSATIDELAAAAGSIRNNMQAVTAAAAQTGDTMRELQEKVEVIAERALSLSDRARRIEEILQIINDIAGQTNMLALNAAIEAARAGEAGQGFSVVAAEVRSLAERSVQSTESISLIITGVQDEMNATISATEQGTRQARNVAGLMASTATMLEESILAIQQQKSASDQVHGAIRQISAAADRLVAEQVHWTDTAERLETLVSELESALRADGGDLARAS